MEIPISHTAVPGHLEAGTGLICAVKSVLVLWYLELVGFWVKISIRDIFFSMHRSTRNINRNNGMGFSITAHQSIKLRFPNHCFQYSFGTGKCLVFCRRFCYSPVPGCLGDICHGDSWKEKYTYFLINSNSLSNGRRVKGGQAVKCKSLPGNHSSKLLHVLLSVLGSSELTLCPACSTRLPHLLPQLHLFTQPHFLWLFSPVLAGFMIKPSRF